MSFFRRLIAALFENREFRPSRAERRRQKRMAGRMNPDGRYFGGVDPKIKAKKVERWIAGK